MRGGIQQELLIARAHQSLSSMVDDALEVPGYGFVVPFSILMDPGNGAARQDVVELLEQDQPPEPLELVRGIGVGRTEPDGSGGAPQLGLAQEVFAPTVASLGLCLAGVRSAVHFQVHLANPDGQVGVLGLGLGEELPGCAHVHLRRAFQVRRSMRSGNHFARRSAAAVAIAEGHQ
ncbi:hypothetical protein D3C73_1102390 [compost metagenome]